MENPFLSTVITEWNFLDSVSGRNICPLCKKSRKYYCYTCLVALPHIAELIPKVKLPLKVDIIKHPSELDGKSTSVHAAVLAPEDVTVHTYPCIPDYDPEKTVLVFPCADSLTLEELHVKLKREDKITPNTEKDNLDKQLDSNEMCKPQSDSNNCTKLSTKPDAITNGDNSFNTVLCDQEIQSENCKPKANIETSRKRQLGADSSERSDCSASKQFKPAESLPIQRVVLIDSTWNQTKNITSDERLQGLTKVELKSQVSNFWRSQEGIPKTYLSTIEALYYFVRDFHQAFVDETYNNEYDNLLFFFCFMYNKIKMSQQRQCKKDKPST